MEISKTADEVLGTGGNDDRLFVIESLWAVRGTLLVLASAAEVNGEAQLDHLDDVIEMLTGERPR